MRAQNKTCFTTLTIDQLNNLIAIVTEEHGPDLPLKKFTNAVLILCEDIAGVELLTSSQRNQLLKKLWTRYQCFHNDHRCS